MSKIDNMIAKLCPNGVEYKTLGEIATDLYRGSGISRDQITENGTPCVRYGEIYTTYGIWFNKCKSHTKFSDIVNPKFFEHGDILFAITGESVEDIAKSTAYIGNEKCLAGGDIVVMKHKQNPKYIAYALSTFSAQKQKSKGKIKSKVVHSSVPAISEITIPVPPLKIQEEIVALLDDYTEKTSELISNLEKELIARKKQYEFYRDQLLSFGKVSPPLTSGTNKVNWMTLGEISDLLSGFPFNSEQFAQKGIKLVRGMNVKRGYLDFAESNNKYWATDIGLEKYRLMEGDIIIAMDGSLVGKSFGLVSKNDLPLLLVQRVARIRTKESYSNQYIYHCIKSALPAYVDSQKTAGAVPHISLKDLSNFKIPVPCFAEQKRIATILTHFDTLVNDISHGIPAEIEARKKQYEFYRDKLLSFKKAV